jgi:hypothetical protein
VDLNMRRYVVLQLYLFCCAIQEYRAVTVVAVQDMYCCCTAMCGWHTSRSKQDSDGQQHS